MFECGNGRPRRREPRSGSVGGVVVALATIGVVAGGAAAIAQPGQVDVDPAAAERALERTLTAEGALLLPRGRFELEPSLTYVRRESADFVAFQRDDTGEIVNFGSVEFDRDEVTVQLDFRVGLPFNTQFELGVPYDFVNTSSTSEFINGRVTAEDDGSGFGDLSVGIAGTVLREEGWRPDLIARLTWDTATGMSRDGDLVLNNGFNEIRGSLTFLKRQDPLAFVGSLFYGTSFEKDDVTPGDEYGFAVQTVLAASPATSLRLGFSQSFSQDTTVGDRTIGNSGQNQGLLQLGASTTLGPGILLDLSLSAGLTEDAPAYFVRVGLPLRPNLSLF